MREMRSGDGARDMSELHGCMEASDLTRMANSCESLTEPSLASTGLRQLWAPAKMAMQLVVPVSERDAVPHNCRGKDEA